MVKWRVTLEVKYGSKMFFDFLDPQDATYFASAMVRSFNADATRLDGKCEFPLEVVIIPMLIEEE